MSVVQQNRVAVEVARRLCADYARGVPPQGTYRAAPLHAGKRWVGTHVDAEVGSTRCTIVVWGFGLVEVRGTASGVGLASTEAWWQNRVDQPFWYVARAPEATLNATIAASQRPGGRNVGRPRRTRFSAQEASPRAIVVAP